ncbi:hypothetical protein HPB52_007543 [Rhipicephalus sanguineus]|uniref:Uncharacterized protein n=1 Tax=Rhipicephalus sanguineus TaxID=34632 RepID=A0A9D4PP37_RHISA|nr:hypothetical protein HPB52_007543 [Rhipicephalus sanguineus]
MKVCTCSSKLAPSSPRSTTPPPPLSDFLLADVQDWSRWVVACCPPVVCDKQGRILLVGLNRPEKRNCLNVAAAQLLVEAFREFDRDNSVDVAVLHGKGCTEEIDLMEKKTV